MRFIITTTPATPNGDLHIGHIAGPYMAADVCKRYQKLQGNVPVHITGGDDNQPYVVTSSERFGVDPKSLTRESNQKIQKAFEQTSIEIDAYSSPNDIQKEVQQLFLEFYEKSWFVEKRKKQWFCPQCHRQLVGSYVKGYCQHCLAETAGSICEDCGYANDSYHIHNASCSKNPNHSLREVECNGLYFETEKLRKELSTFYQSKVGIWRPHVIELALSVLKNPLDDFQVSYTSNWGIPVPLDLYQGQVINPWFEMWVLFITSSKRVLQDDIWERKTNTKFVQFLGYDNAFFFLFFHVPLLLVKNYLLPDTIITNEFYQLDGFKFSTSKNHLILAKEIVQKVDSDFLRLYLCLSGPMYQVTNFSENSMRETIQKKWIGPWNRIVEQMNRALALHGVEKEVEQDVHHARYRAILCHISNQFQKYYEPDSMSLNRVAELLVSFLVWMDQSVCASKKPSLQEIGDQFGLLVAFGVFAYPIMPKFGAKLVKRITGQSKISWNAIHAHRVYVSPIQEKYDLCSV